MEIVKYADILNNAPNILYILVYCVVGLLLIQSNANLRIRVFLYRGLMDSSEKNKPLKAIKLI